MSDLGIATLLDLGQLQNVLEDFSAATGLATIAVDTRGIPVTNAFAFTDFCRQMRSDPVHNQMCHACDAHGGLQSVIDGSPQIYSCHAGLVDFSVPITDGDTYVGGILCGQVRVQDAQRPWLLTPGTAWRGDMVLERMCEELPVSTLNRVAAAAKTPVRCQPDARGGRAGTTPPRDPAAPGVPAAAPAAVPRTAVEPSAPPPVAQHAALRDAIDAQDLSSAYAETSRMLDELYGSTGDLREGVAHIEDLVIEMLKHGAYVLCDPELVAKLVALVVNGRHAVTEWIGKPAPQLLEAIGVMAPLVPG